MLCGGQEKETCCSHSDEMKLLRTWNTYNRNNIQPYTEGYIWLMKAIFNYYEVRIYKYEIVNCY